MVTAYQNFIQDYPERCKKLLSQCFKDAERNNLEVTLLLNIATSGLIVPFERLSNDNHPSEDATRFQDAHDTLIKALEAPFLSSVLHPEESPGSWKSGELKELRGDPDAWGLETLKTLTKKKTSKPIVKILRNALAHGNIFTRGRPHIETLVFLSRVDSTRPEAGYNCLTVSPMDLMRFTFCWLQLLADVGIPGQTFREATSLAEIAA
jgi:hypothetical protein